MAPFLRLYKVKSQVITWEQYSFNCLFFCPFTFDFTEPNRLSYIMRISIKCYIIESSLEKLLQLNLFRNLNYFLSRFCIFPERCQWNSVLKTFQTWDWWTEIFMKIGTVKSIINLNVKWKLLRKILKYFWEL